MDSKSDWSYVGDGAKTLFKVIAASSNVGNKRVSFSSARLMLTRKNSSCVSKSMHFAHANSQPCRPNNSMVFSKSLRSPPLWHSATKILDLFQVRIFGLGIKVKTGLRRGKGAKALGRNDAPFRSCHFFPHDNGRTVKGHSPSLMKFTLIPFISPCQSL